MIQQLIGQTLSDRKEQELVGSAPGELPIDPTGTALQLEQLLKGKVVEHRELVSWGPASPAR
jgi:hypothetical protein